MSATVSPSHSIAVPTVATALLPIMAAVSLAFLVIGVALPVLPLHVHQKLGLSTFVVGLITGTQFLAALMSRVWAGRFADRAGAKRAVVVGMLTAVAGGLLYLLSLLCVATPAVSAGILLLGRGLLGGAESFVITGGVSWGLALVGPTNAGRVIAWIGMAMFAALAFGAPIGSSLYALGGFTAIAVATAIVPLAAIALVAPLAAVPVQRGARTSLLKVARAVWMPGIGSALSSIGLGAMIAFSSLLAAERQWSPVWLFFSVFAAALVVARLFSRTRSGQARWRAGCAGLRIDRGRRLVAHLACARADFRCGWRAAHRPWLCAGLPWPRRRGRPPRAAGKPRRCHGRIHCLP